MKPYDPYRSERPLSFGRFDLDALIRACLGLRTRVPDRQRVSLLYAEEPHPDFEDTMPAARASVPMMPLR